MLKTPSAQTWSPSFDEMMALCLFVAPAAALLIPAVPPALPQHPVAIVRTVAPRGESQRASARAVSQQ